MAPMGEEGLAHVNACGQRGGGKNPFFVDIINGWPLTAILSY